jgi:hypothetical protein
VKYSIRKVPAGTTSVYDRDVWEVLKTPSSVDPYLIATFHDPALARWCLGSLRMSMEVQRMGSTVEDSPEDVLFTTTPNPHNLPDELAW